MEDQFRTKVHEFGRTGTPVQPRGLDTATAVVGGGPGPGMATLTEVAGPPGPGMATAVVGGTARGAATPAAQAAAQAAAAAEAASAKANAGTGFEVTPEQYRAAVSPMLAASDRVSTAYLALDSFLTSMNATHPWGNDHAGHQFAEGGKGYLAYSAGTLKGLKGLPAALRRVADGLKLMAENYETTERRVVGTLKGRKEELDTYRPMNPLPAADALPQAPVPVAPTLPAPHVGPIVHTGGRR
ncbi:WXG100 family type VII secretion target [Kitasatospora sp. NPDC050543]|uniref:WXG100 family type VII secretion target n=1 Tax=Kitasatospora sp. NPDC050543 TaxID=3364054 RepID=UPI0037A949A4